MIVNNKLLIMNHLLQNLVRQFHCSRIRRAYEGSGKSTINVLNVAGPKLYITSCTPVGFKLNNNSTVLGPLAIFPKTILCWDIACGSDINEATLSLFTALEPKLDILILGVETKYDYNTIKEIRKLLIKRNINTEILPVDRACGVYNFLCEEGRHVAAGLIPPLVEETLLYKKLESTMSAVKKEKLIESK